MILGQLRPKSEQPEVIYRTKPGGEIVDSIYVCNTSNGDEHFYIYIDAQGRRFNKDTAIFHYEEIDRHEAGLVPIGMDGIRFGNSTAIAVRTSNGGAINFTVFGRESR